MTGKNKIQEVIEELGTEKPPLMGGNSIDLIYKLFTPQKITGTLPNNFSLNWKRKSRALSSLQNIASGTY